MDCKEFVSACAAELINDYNIVYTNYSSSLFVSVRLSVCMVYKLQLSVICECAAEYLYGVQTTAHRYL